MYKILGVVCFYLFVFLINDKIIAQIQSITWVDQVGVQTSGNTITKNNPTGWGNSGAASSNILPSSANGYIEFTISSIANVMFGFSSNNQDANYNTINFAIHPRNINGIGYLAVFENGIEKTSYNPDYSTPYFYVVNDKIRISRSGTTISYQKNGITFYTSTISSSSSLIADAAIHDENASISNAQLSIESAGGANNIVWIDLIGVQANGNTITKTNPTGWANGGAASTILLPASTNGYIEFTISSIANVMFGFSTNNQDANYTTINFAIHPRKVNGLGYLAVYENGTEKTPFNPDYSTPYSYTINDVVRVTRIGTTISYQKNGITFYTSTISSSSSLLADAAIHEQNAAISNAQYVVGVSNPGGSNPTPPTIITTSNITSNSIQVNWSGATNATSYQVEYATASGGPFNVFNSNISVTSVTVTGLTASTPYWFRVKSINGANSSSYITTSSSTSTSAVTGGGSSQWTGTTAGIYYNSHVHIGKANTTKGTEMEYSLFVKGGIKTDKIKVEIPSTSGANGWADFVFKPDYKLLPIKQLEKFIKTNNHLPGFPSEKSIFLNGGYEMSDMIRRQQASIEELHLYIIELEKKVGEMKILEKRVKELEKKLKN